MDPVFSIALALLTAAGVGAGFAWLLAGAGIPGGRAAAAIMGGLLAGVLLGPAVLGRAAPAAHEQLYRGGAEERQALRSMTSRHAADRAAASAVSGATPGALVDLFAQQAAERAPLELDAQLAVAAHRERLTGAAAVIVAAGLMLGAWAGRPPRVVGAGLVVGAAAVVAEVAVIGGIMHVGLGASVALAVAAGAAGVGGSALAGLPMHGVPAGGRSALARTAAGAMFLLAMVAVGVVAGDRGRVIVAALIAGPLLGWGLRMVVGRPVIGARMARGALLGVIVPGAAALAGALVEWGILRNELRATITAPLLVLLSGNAALGGMWLASRLAGRSLTVSQLLVWHGAGFGPTQVCVVLAIIAAEVADPTTPMGSAVVAGLLVSAVLGEVMLGVLRGVGKEGDGRSGE